MSKNTMSKKLALSCAATLLISAAVVAQPVDRARGVDQGVDYAALKTLGPWDDRNYALTAADLALLADNEAELRVMVPAFYRVELRKRYPEMRRTGRFQYPRSTLPRFLVEHGGYLVDRQLYRSAERHENGFDIDLAHPWRSHEAWATKALSGEVRVGPGAETAIAMHPSNPDLVIAGSNGPGGQVMYYSSDGGATWSSAGVLANSCCDPTVAWSSDGTRAYTVTLGRANDVYLSTNNGRTWSLLAEIGQTGDAVDKEYLHVDTFPTSPHKDNLYLTWHLGNDMRFSRSTNGGVTWSTPVTLSNFAQQGIGSDITTDKAGHVYYLWPATGGENWVRKSTDGGSTWQPAVRFADTVGAYDFPVPAMSSRRVFMYVSGDSDLSNGAYANSIYVAYTDNTVPTTETAANNHARIQVAYSRDGGATWAISTPHATADQNSVDRFHPWLKVGPDGKVWVVFYDTRHGSRSSVDFYYAVSSDGAQTWSPPERLTTVSSAKPNDDFEWGDYNGMDLVMNQLIGIYTDNRNEGGGGGDSVDAYVVGTVTFGDLTTIFSDGFDLGNTDAWSSEQ
ncbi:MAG: sialidase family protein [Acidobacteriota bacterium]